jgi:hypothetical protein
MNWLSSESAEARNVARLLDSGHGEACEHVEVDRSLAVVVLKEDDSFGPVVRRVVCTQCLETHERYEAAQTVVCHDCGAHKPAGECREWRCYDFYAPQGDEPLIVCKACWDLPAHKQRRADDRQDRLEEDVRYGHAGACTFCEQLTQRTGEFGGWVCQPCAADVKAKSGRECCGSKAALVNAYAYEGCKPMDPEVYCPRCGADGDEVCECGEGRVNYAVHNGLSENDVRNICPDCGRICE